MHTRRGQAKTNGSRLIIFREQGDTIDIFECVDVRIQFLRYLQDTHLSSSCFNWVFAGFCNWWDLFVVVLLGWSLSLSLSFWDGIRSSSVLAGSISFHPYCISAEICLCPYLLWSGFSSTLLNGATCSPSCSLYDGFRTSIVTFDNSFQISLLLIGANFSSPCLMLAEFQTSQLILVEGNRLFFFYFSGRDIPSRSLVLECFRPTLFWCDPLILISDSTNV